MSNQNSSSGMQRQGMQAGMASGSSQMGNLQQMPMQCLVVPLQGFPQMMPVGLGMGQMGFLPMDATALPIPAIQLS